MTFKVVVSDPKTKKAYQKEVEKAASGLSGKKIGDKFSGKILGLDGYELEITGGSDRDGFPMRKDVSGTTRKRVLLAFGPGFHPKKKGERKRKSIRGNTIADDIAQINVKVVKAGSKSIAASFGVEEKKEEPKKEAKAEAKTEAPKTDAPKEEPKKEEPKKEEVKEKPKEEKKEPAKEEKPKEEPKKEVKKEAPAKEEPKKEAPKEKPKEEKPKEEPKAEEKPKEEAKPEEKKE